ncbi:HAD family hydrolase [Sphingomonas sp.]|uniref:HAD family hydrolase n=1 Tax=Sphingomonas sp. TaxID=28214 RepID=UPI003B3AD9B5
MVRHFGEWLDEAHAITFRPEGGAFADALTRKACGSLVPEHEVWPLLDGFFASQMERQTLTPGAAEALGRIGEVSDIVILTNLKDWCHAGRAAQLAAHGIRHRVVCNQGGKGMPVARLASEHAATVTVFVDDLEGHHESVATHAPDVFRLHMIGEPAIAPTIPPAPHAHARIDRWDEAVEWVLARFRGDPLP